MNQKNNTGIDSSKRKSLSINEYRKIMNDQVSPDELITKRLNYLKALCSKIIKDELSKLKK